MVYIHGLYTVYNGAGVQSTVAVLGLATNQGRRQLPQYLTQDPCFSLDEPLYTLGIGLPVLCDIGQKNREFALFSFAFSAFFALFFLRLLALFFGFALASAITRKKRGR